MQPYSYTIALRIWHPSIDPVDITAALRINPKHTNKAGLPRQTLKGTLLGGVYAESYWHADPFEYGEQQSGEVSAEDALSELLDALTPHRDFLRELRNEGARVILQLTSHGNRNYAIELSPGLLGKCSDLGVSLAHDVYPFV